MVTKVVSGGVHGIEGYPVSVETDISEGMPSFDLCGNLGSEVRESKERVRTALKNTGFYLPVKKITVNLSPSDRRKYGTGYDLAIAVSILLAMGELNELNTKDAFFIGELMLSGQVRPIKGVLPLVIMARDLGFRRCILPKENIKEGAIVKGIEVYGVESLKEAVDFLLGEEDIERYEYDFEEGLHNLEYENDMSMVNGQHLARRGIEIAVAGYHNILLVGPPGAGKSMISKCIPSIMPQLTLEECLKISSIYSVGGLLSKEGLITKRPFIAPHHTASDISIIGGGIRPKPGAVSYASKGVLFMDEFPEFSRQTLEALRQPLEDRKVFVSRNLDSIEYPADFMLVAAMNPCPCGAYPDLSKCTCTKVSRQRYLNKLSKPLLDRIDICIEVKKVGTRELLSKKKNESSKEIRKRVERSHEIQKDRFKNTSILFNSQMSNKEIEKYVYIGAKEKRLLDMMIDKYNLSARAYYRILKVSRTIADLLGEELIGEESILEALRLKYNSDLIMEV